MTDFLLLLLCGACWTWGIKCLFSEGYLFAGVGNMIRKKLPTSPETYASTWLTRPWFDCPPCMGSVHGFIISGAYFNVNLFHLCGTPMMDIYKVIAYMVCLCGLNFIIKSILFPEYEDISPD